MDMYDESRVLCAASAYDKKYYLGPKFTNLPEGIQEELRIMCVLFTEDVGGILTLEFDDDGDLMLKTEADETDILYDEIGSALKVKQLQAEKRELLEELELYYKVRFLKKDLGELAEE
jgi:hypothetical protein